MSKGSVNLLQPHTHRLICAKYESLVGAPHMTDAAMLQQTQKAHNVTYTQPSLHGHIHTAMTADIVPLK